MPHIIIVGAGLAGLVVAHLLVNSMPVRVTILERAAQPGGRIRTDLVDGCVVEAGPDSFLSTRPHALSLCADLGIADEIEGTIPRRTRGFIVRNGRFHALPEGLTGLIPARLGPLLRTRALSPAGRARFAAELFIPPDTTREDESVASFARRRFGVEAWQWLIEPLLGGIHGGDGEQLSLRATFPALADAERRAGSVLMGLRGGQRTEPRVQTPFVAPRGGMGRLIDALRAHIPFDIRCDAHVTSVTRGADGWISNVNGTANECDAIVLAVPACQAAELLPDAAAPLAAVLSDIPFVSATVVNMAFDEVDPGTSLDGYGYLNPRASGCAVAACTWTTSKFAHRAPAGTVLVRCFLRGEQWANPAETSDSDLAEACLAELRGLLRLRAEPRWFRTARWPAAMPQYTLGHLARMRSIDAALGTQPGLFLTGNSYRGVGIPDTIAHARFVAGRVLARFT
ncbi:MAG: protoporphyrinogen oxidase [Longimicrobiales bacterium]